MKRTACRVADVHGGCLAGRWAAAYQPGPATVQSTDVTICWCLIAYDFYVIVQGKSAILLMYMHRINPYAEQSIDQGVVCTWESQLAVCG